MYVLSIRELVGEHTFASNVKKGTEGDIPLCPLELTFSYSVNNDFHFFEKKFTNALTYK